MKDITLEELKQIQVGILEHVVTFCKENKIPMSVSSGTLLGAVRHKGYIPWDDDIDIMLLRNDYEKFIDIYIQTQNCKYKLITHKIDANYPYTFAKIVDDSTVLREDGFSEKNAIGVYVDIFPMDDVPLGKTFRNKISYLWYEFYGQILKAIYRRLLSLYLHSNKSFTHRLFRWHLKMMDEYFKRQYPECRYVTNKFFEQNFGVHIRKSAFASMEELEFDRLKVPAIKGWNEYLAVMYGDYMTPPKENDRASTHKFTAWYKSTEK